MADLMCVEDHTESVQKKSNHEETYCLCVHCSCAVLRNNCYFCET